jgi:hypothetical protein
VCGAGAGVVSRLTKGWEGKWHTIVMDNFFTSPMLFEDLLQRQFYAIGTARHGRIGFPSSLNVLEKERRGTLQICVHMEGRMAAIHWQDVKGVHFLSTRCDPVQHGGVLVERVVRGKKVKIPTSPIQLAYASNMRGVDTQDQVRIQYTTQLSTKKWWHRLFFFRLDAAFANSYLMYKHMFLAGGQKPMDHYTFLLEVSHALIGILLLHDYAKPVQKDVHAGGGRPGTGEGTDCLQLCSAGFGVSDDVCSGSTVPSTVTAGGASGSTQTAWEAPAPISEGVHEDTTFPVPSSQESNMLRGGEMNGLPYLMNRIGGDDDRIGE